jgi:uncharacterized repeat protein (TIGR01451 family)
MAASIALLKTSVFLDDNGDGFAGLGEKVKYTFTVTNSGTEPLTNISIADPRLGSLILPVTGTLAVGASTIVTTDYLLTAPDLEAGEINNTATVTASGLTTTVTGSANAIQGYNVQTGLDLTKTATISNTNGNAFVGDAGDTIVYSYGVTNNSSRTGLNLVLVDDNGTADPLDDVTLTLGGPGLTSEDNGPVPNDLAIGKKATATFNYIIPQSAVDLGRVRNNATVTGVTKIGVPIGGETVRTVSLTRTPAIEVIKTAGPITDTNGDGFDSVGDKIVYNYTVKNTGNVTLTNVTLVDDDGTVIASDDKTITLTKTTLAPNETTTGTYTGTLTQAAINAANLTNIATAKGTPPPGVNPNPVTDTDTKTVIPKATPAIDLIKKAGAIVDANKDGVNSAGDTVQYDYTVKNTGNVTLTNVTLVDDNGTPSVTTDDVTITLTVVTPLAPGQSTTGSYVGTLTQAAIDKGDLTNIANVSGKPPTGPNVTDTDTQIVKPTGSAAIDLIKKAGVIVDANKDGVNSAGDTVTYDYTVKNTGNVTLKEVTLKDDNGTPADTTDDVIVTLGATTLTPGQSTTGSYVGKLTQAAIDKADLTNIANVSGKPPTGPNVTDIDTQIVKPTGAAAIDLIKKAGAIEDSNNDKVNSVGDKVTYDYTVKNTGNVTLTAVTLIDDNGTPGITTDDVTVPLLKDKLAPGETTTGKYVGTLTQAALTSGVLTNIATVTGKPPTGPNVSDFDTQTVKPAGTPAITLVKTAGAILDSNGDKIQSVGDTVVYTYTATNTGNVPLFNVSLKDDNGTATLGSDDFVVPLTVGLTDLDADLALDDLVIGGVAVGTYTKTLTAADLALTAFTNLGTVTGVDRTGTIVKATDPETITFLPPAPPHVSLKKSAHVDLGADDCLNEGDIITYTFTVTNTGKIKIDAVQISDILPGLSQIKFDKPFSTLNPGDVITATATYAITEQNICDCFVENFATVYGNPLGGKPNDTSDDAIAKDGLIVRFDNGNWSTESVDVAPPVIDLGGNGGSTPNPGTPPATPVTPPVLLPGLPTTSGNTIYGTAGNDVINPGGNVDYVVYANEGQNAIVTGNGQDALYGGSDLDVFVAGNGDNTIYANEGRNIAITGNGQNTVYGGSSADWIFTGSGDDLIYANEGDNYVSAGAGDNRVYIGGGKDYVVLTGGAGFSKVYNFNASQDTFGLAGINAADITVEAVTSGGYFTRISAGADVLAELDGANLTKAQIQFETLGNAGNSSVSFLADPLRSDLRNQLVAAGTPVATVNSLFA